MSCSCQQEAPSSVFLSKSNQARMTAEFNPSFGDKERTILSAISSLQIVSGSLLNSLVILLLSFNVNLLQVPSNLILLSLTISDFISCSFFLPYHLYLLHLCCLSQWQHQACRILAAFCSSCSVNNIIAMTLDRFFAVVRPLRYNVIVTSSKVRHLLALAWCGATAYTGLFFTTMYFNLASIKFFLECVAFGMVFLTIGLYWRIFRSAREQIRKIQAVYKFQSAGLKMSLKSAVTSGRVVLLLVISYVPLLVYAILIESSSSPRSIEEKSQIFSWVLSFSFWNSCANPLVYFICSRKFRATIRLTLRRWMRLREPSKSTGR